MVFVLNILVSAVVISFASWLSGRLPTLAGFFVALPISTMLVLPLSYQEHGDAEASILLVGERVSGRSPRVTHSWSRS